MQLHGSIYSSLQHASTWASLSAVLAAGSAALTQPYQQWCVGASMAMGIIGVLLRTPDMDKDDEKDEQCRNCQ